MISRQPGNACPAQLYLARNGNKPSWQHHQPMNDADGHPLFKEFGRVDGFIILEYICFACSATYIVVSE